MTTASTLTKSLMPLSTTEMTLPVEAIIEALKAGEIHECPVFCCSECGKIDSLIRIVEAENITLDDYEESGPNRLFNDSEGISPYLNRHGELVYLSLGGWDRLWGGSIHDYELSDLHFECCACENESTQLSDIAVPADLYRVGQRVYVNDTAAANVIDVRANHSGLYGFVFEYLTDLDGHYYLASELDSQFVSSNQISMFDN